MNLAVLFGQKNGRSPVYSNTCCRAVANRNITYCSSQFAAQLATTLDVDRFVDRFVRHPHLRPVGKFDPELAGDLGRGPQPFEDQRPPGRGAPRNSRVSSPWDDTPARRHSDVQRSARNRLDAHSRLLLGRSSTSAGRADARSQRTIRWPRATTRCRPDPPTRQAYGDTGHHISGRITPPSGFVMFVIAPIDTPTSATMSR